MIKETIEFYKRCPKCRSVNGFDLTPSEIDTWQKFACQDCLMERDLIDWLIATREEMDVQIANKIIKKTKKPRRRDAWKGR